MAIIFDSSKSLRHFCKSFWFGLSFLNAPLSLLVAFLCVRPLSEENFSRFLQQFFQFPNKSLKDEFSVASSDGR